MAYRKRSNPKSRQMNRKLKYRKKPQTPLIVEKKRLVRTTDDTPLPEAIEARSTGIFHRKVTAGAVVRTEEFDERYSYGGPLGVSYSREGTLLRVWAPTAEEIQVEIYETVEEGATIIHRIPMFFAEPGIWEALLLGDQQGTVYTYHLTFSDGMNHSTMDPYSRAVVANGEKSVILDPQSVEVRDFERMAPFSHPVDAVIYEMHVRDFSMHPDSGIRHQGKFLGVIEKETRNSVGSPTGLKYLQELGVTHVQLLPIFDYSTVDEFHSEDYYNWGYDPKNYNVPEGSYATDPFDPPRRIIELKEMIKGLHEAGIRVIMDVVYNHVYEVSMDSLHKTVPGYFFRYDKKGNLSNGTGVGNDTASERLMMRKYILDSVRYWLEEYKVDGFRFDLMGIHDVETMNEVRRVADSIDPSIIILGEGWNMGTTLPQSRRAWQGNAHRMPRIGHFNDVIRDAARGAMFHGRSRGFVTGQRGMEKELLVSLSGRVWPKSGASYQEPVQLIQYVEAHDNMTLYDKLVESSPGDSEEVRIRRHTLGTSLVLLAQGVPFLHGGQEFLRTKYGDDNSYRSGDEVNRFDWCRQDIYRGAVDYVKGLIQIRKDQPLFRMRREETIARQFQELQSSHHIISFALKDESNELIVIFNGSDRERTAKVKKGSWQVLVRDMEVFKEPPDILIRSSHIKIEPLSAMVLMRKTGQGQ